MKKIRFATLVIRPITDWYMDFTILNEFVLPWASAEHFRERGNHSTI